MKWKKIAQRNLPALCWAACAENDLNIQVGPLFRKHGPVIAIRYKTEQTYYLQDSMNLYTSNLSDLILKKNTDLERSFDAENEYIYSIVRSNPGTSLEDLQMLNLHHSRVTGLMLLMFDLLGEIRERVDEVFTDQTDAFNNYINTPWKPTVIQREQEALEEAKEQIRITPDIESELFKNLASEFGYIHQDYVGKPWNESDYRDVLNDMDETGTVENKVYDSNNLSDYEQWLVVILKKSAYMFEEGRNAMVRCIWAMQETVRRLGFDSDQLLYMTTEEIDNFVKDRAEYITKDLACAREQAFAIYFDGNAHSEYTGQAEVEKFIKEKGIAHFWEDNTEEAKELSGSVAQKGVATGKVRIVLTQEDADQIRDGEILVSPMTQVEFLSGMRKCDAIITDEGGIICHAAIVAREFKKPCIIGTKIATQVLKDGDMVEVDADKGIVRILEK